MLGELLPANEEALMKQLLAGQWYSTFLMLQLFNVVPQVMNPNHRIIFLLLHNCNFSVMNHVVSI